MQLTREEIDRLSPQERHALIAQLWDSLDDDETPLPPAQQAELERRLATFDRDRAQAVTWEDLKAELTNRCTFHEYCGTCGVRACACFLTRCSFASSPMR